jgi:hypothetical protein
VRIHGFLTVGGANSNESTGYVTPYNGLIDSNWSFTHQSRVGVRLDAAVASDVKAQVQLLATGQSNEIYTSLNSWARVGIDNASLTFGKGTYAVRAGRFRTPAFLYSATQPVGHSYAWVRLPSEVYRISPFAHMNGVDMVYHLSASHGLNVLLHPFFGTERPTDTAFSENLGGRIMGTAFEIQGKNALLHGLYSRSKFTEVGSGSTALKGTHADYWEVGMKAHMHRILLESEYACRTTKTKDMAALAGYYGTVGYRLHRFVPTFTYAHLKTTNTPTNSDLAVYQNSYTLGMRYALSHKMAVKTSVARVTPEKDSFGLFTAKPAHKHVYVYGASLDVLF